MTDTNPDTWELSDTEVFARYGDAFVPRRAEQAEIVVDLLNSVPPGEVLDLCCGEGRLSAEFLLRDPSRRVALLDGSKEMLSLAEGRLADFAGRVRTVRADIADRSWREPARYAGVMTSLAVHHLDGPGKQQLYRDVFAMLIPGGVFVMADLMEPATQVGREVAARGWDEAVHQASHEQFGGDAAERAFTATGWNYYRLSGPDPIDKPSSVAQHLNWLGAAGFQGVDVVWMYAGHAVITATKGGNA